MLMGPRGACVRVRKATRVRGAMAAPFVASTRPGPRDDFAHAKTVRPGHAPSRVFDEARRKLRHARSLGSADPTGTLGDPKGTEGGSRGTLSDPKGTEDGSRGPLSDPKATAGGSRATSGDPKGTS